MRSSRRDLPHARRRKSADASPTSAPNWAAAWTAIAPVFPAHPVERTRARAGDRDTRRDPADAGLPEAAFAREKARLADSVKEDETKPDAIASKAFYRLLYGAHPYALAPTPDTVMRIERADVENFYRANYVAGRAVVTIIGDVDRALAERIAEQVTAGLPPRARRAGPASAGEPAAGRDDAHCAPGIAKPYPARPAGDDAQRSGLLSIAVGNYTLGGGGFVSRLMREVREKRGYATASTVIPAAGAGRSVPDWAADQEGTGGEALARVRVVLDEFLARGRARPN